jgi:hypothetical protein
LDSRNVEFKVPSVSPGVFVETLVLFPTKLVPEAKNVVNENALERIMANEGKLAEEANIIREEARQQVQREEELREKLRSVGTVLSILLIILWFPVIFHIYRKYDKELSHSFQGKYYRELPGEYTPAEMSVLMSFGTVSTRDIMATLMDLIRKKQLMLTSSKAYKKGLFGGKDIVTYVILLNEKAPTIELKRHEQYLIDWFIHKIGNGISVTLDEIKDYDVKTRKSLELLVELTVKKLAPLVTIEGTRMWQGEAYKDLSKATKEQLAEAEKILKRTTNLLLTLCASFILAV